jgi:hypothetical protein
MTASATGYQVYMRVIGISVENLVFFEVIGAYKNGNISLHIGIQG